jgi:DNA mismatch endonuclease (patch repair protein)
MPSLRRTADLVFTRQRIAVFIDGCFWHGCPEHHRRPRANAEYWAMKVNGNRLRDISTDETLTAAHWTVLRFWEHEDPVEVAEAIRAAVRAASSS